MIHLQHLALDAVVDVLADTKMELHDADAIRREFGTLPDEEIVRNVLAGKVYVGEIWYVELTRSDGSKEVVPVRVFCPRSMMIFNMVETLLSHDAFADPSAVIADISVMPWSDHSQVAKCMQKLSSDSPWQVTAHGLYLYTQAMRCVRRAAPFVTDERAYEAMKARLEAPMFSIAGWSVSY